MPKRITKNVSPSTGKVKKSNTAVVPSSLKRAEIANVFFDSLFQMLDAESDLVTNTEVDPIRRVQIRQSVKHLKDMIASAQRFHGHRFSDETERVPNAAVEVQKLIQLHNRWFRDDRDLGLLKAVAWIDDRTKFQPTVFEKKFPSVSRAALNVLLLHYGHFVDAIEQMKAGAMDKRTFTALCNRFDRMTSLSFTTPGKLPLIEGESQSGPMSKAPSSRKRGRPRVTDPAEKQIVAMWESGQHRTYKDCAIALAAPDESIASVLKRVRKVMDRHRKDKSRARKSKPDSV